MNFPGVNILDEMPEGKNVLIWGKVEKVNTRFMQRGTYAIMDFELFKELINGQVR